LKNTAKEMARAFFIAPESVALALVLLFVVFLPRLVITLGLKIQEGQFAVVSSVIGAPVALTLATWYRGRELLHPTEKHRETLVAWPDYWRLTLRNQCALLWALCGVVLCGVGLLLIFASHPRIGAGAVLGGVAISGVAMVTTALASLVVRDILDGARPGG
jgi:hypothetical protein